MANKKIKLAIASTLLIALAACANNNGDEVAKGPRNQRNVATRNLDVPRNVSTGDLKHPIRNRNGLNDNQSLSTTEIQPMNNGFITIDQNSYCTGTPSNKFPHSKRVQNGKSWYYTFGSEMDRPKSSKQGQPRNGGVTPPQEQKQVTPAKPPVQQPTTQPTTGVSQVASKVIDLTNAERKKNGLAPLKADTSLSKVAQVKSDDMKTKKYFSHTSPTYGSPFDMMRDFGVTYRTAGENIAMGQPTAQEVVAAWMKSEGHRKNILSPNYTNIGVGYTQAGNYWTQMFIGK